MINTIKGMLAVVAAVFLPIVAYFLVTIIFDINKWVVSLIGGNEMVTATMTVVSCLLIIVCAARLIEDGDGEVRDR